MDLSGQPRIFRSDVGKALAPLQQCFWVFRPLYIYNMFILCFLFRSSRIFLNPFAKMGPRLPSSTSYHPDASWSSADCESPERRVFQLIAVMKNLQQHPTSQFDLILLEMFTQNQYVRRYKIRLYWFFRLVGPTTCR